MILKNRLFERVPPTRDAKSIYIFCEGVRTEYKYFQYFREMDSRINIEIHELKPDENNSPKGLMDIAKSCLDKTESNPNPKYEMLAGDEVWVVFDTDPDKLETRKPQIVQLREECNNLKWQVAQSNPCFEVWLYYHFCDKNAEFQGKEISKEWKRFLDKEFGGFDTRKHPLYIETAAKNAENNFISQNNQPDIGATEVYKLSQSILPFVKNKLDAVLKTK